MSKPTFSVLLATMSLFAIYAVVTRLFSRFSISHPSGSSTTTYRYQPKICQLYGKKDSFRLLWTKRANTRSFLYLVKLIDLLCRQFFAELEIERIPQKCLFDYNFFNRHRCHKPESRLNWKYARNCWVFFDARSNLYEGSHAFVLNRLRIFMAFRIFIKIILINLLPLNFRTSVYFTV